MLLKELLMFESTASQSYIFVNPKNKKNPLSGEYLALVQTETAPMENGLKKVKMGAYTRDELIKVAGLKGHSTHLVDQLPHEYEAPEIQTGRAVTVKSGKAAFTTHMGKKITLTKEFTDWLISKKYLIVDDETTSEKEPDPDSIFPNTIEGVKDMLKVNADKSWLKRVDLESCTFRRDPSVDGVWEVKMKSGKRIIAYLAGYKDPWGKKRDTNDFESDFEVW